MSERSVILILSSKLEDHRVLAPAQWGTRGHVPLYFFMNGGDGGMNGAAELSQSKELANGSASNTRTDFLYILTAL